MARHSEYYMDEKGIYGLKSQSYPDAIWREDYVTFGEPDTSAQFEKFMQLVLSEGRKQRSRELLSILKEGSRF